MQVPRAFSSMGGEYKDAARWDDCQQSDGQVFFTDAGYVPGPFAGPAAVPQAPVFASGETLRNSIADNALMGNYYTLNTVRLVDQLNTSRMLDSARAIANTSLFPEGPDHLTALTVPANMLERSPRDVLLGDPSRSCSASLQLLQGSLVPPLQSVCLSSNESIMRSPYAAPPGTAYTIASQREREREWSIKVAGGQSLEEWTRLNAERGGIEFALLRAQKATPLGTWLSGPILESAATTVGEPMSKSAFWSNPDLLNFVNQRSVWATGLMP